MKPYKINLNLDEELILQSLKKSEKNVKVLKRLQCIYFKNKGYKNIDLSRILDVSVDTITDWLKIYVKHGFSGLIKIDYSGRRVSKLKEFENQIKDKIEENNISKLAELKCWLEKDLGIKYSISGLSKYLKKNSISLTKKLE